MTDISWKDAAAIWGAGLSTLIVLTKLLPSRPVFLVEPGDAPVSDLTIRIINPAKSMRIVRERFRVKLWGRGTVIGVYSRKSRMMDAGVPGTLVLAVKGESETSVSVNCATERDQQGSGGWLICFTWRGSWLIPLGIPAFVLVSTKRAALFNAAIMDNEGKL
jgi:hypothetical protein